MQKNIGLWVDHEKAVIVSLSGDTPKVRKIESNIEKHVRAAGGARSSTIYGPEDVVAEDKTDRKYIHHLNTYYNSIIKAVRNADSIYIFGPGEAKGELKKLMEQSKPLAECIAAVEKADKMTEHEIIRNVKRFFRD